MACPCGHAGRRYDTSDRKSRRSLAGGFACRCGRAGKLRSDTSRTGTHRLLPRPESVLSCTIGSCRGQSARAIRRRVVSGDYRNRPSETQTASATIKQQVARMSQRVARPRRAQLRSRRDDRLRDMRGSAPTKSRMPLRSCGYACCSLFFAEPSSYKRYAKIVGRAAQATGRPPNNKNGGISCIVKSLHSLQQ
jgi:hypothetical protein